MRTRLERAYVTGLLTGARALIADEEQWCQGALARDRAGRALDAPGDREAAQWCALGALRRVALEWPEAERRRVLDEAMRRLTRAIRYLSPPTWHEYRDELDGCIMAFNDRLPHVTVVAAFDLAIQRAERAREIAWSRWYATQARGEEG